MIKNPTLKIVCASAAGTAALFAHNPYSMVLILLMTALFAYFMQELRYAVKTALLLGKLSLLLAVTVLLSDKSGVPAAAIGPFTIYSGALRAACEASLRIIAASLPLLVVLKSADMKNLMDSLARDLHIPPKYAFALSSAFRFIPDLSSELQDIIEVEKARGQDFESADIIKKTALASSLMLPLLLSALKKSVRSARAAKLRGFEKRTGRSSSTLEAISTIEYMETVTLVTISALLLLWK